MIKGSCLCGGIRFEIDAVRSLTHCHCRHCRKLTGAAQAMFMLTPTNSGFCPGRTRCRPTSRPPGSFRAFCKICGSIAPSKAPYLKTVSIPAGLLIMIPACAPNCPSKAPWWNITDGLPQHEKWVPGLAPRSPT